MASGNFSSNSVNGLQLYVEWSSIQNVNTNTSKVTARLYVKSYSLYGSALSGSYLTINGDKKSWTKSFSISNNSTITTTYVTEHTATVSHNSDGTKSITIKVNMEFNGTYGGTYISDLTASKTVTLDTIPRASALSVPSSVNTGAKLTVTISPSSSSFGHKIGLNIDGVRKHTSSYIAAGTNSYSYEIPHSWLPKTASTTMTVYLYTHTSSSSDAIGCVSKTVTVNVPSSIKPSVSDVAAAISNGMNGQYVQGKSKVTLTATAKAGEGSTLVSYIFKGANIDGASSSYTGTSNKKASSIIQTSGTVTYKVAATDARGRISDDKLVSITVHPYSLPQITSISAQRCLKDGTLNSDGTYAKVTVKASYASVGGANTRVVKLYNSNDNYASGTVALAASNTDGSYTGVYGGSFDIAKSYTIKAVVTDYYNTGGSISKSVVLETATRTLNVARYGNGVAIGGLSSVTNSTDAGKFECNWDAYFNDNLFVTNKITCSNPYSTRNFNINCYWKDEQTHDILVRNTDGLTVGLGWAGSSTYPTVLDIRPTKVDVRGKTNFKSAINCYVDDKLTLKTDEDETGAFIRSLPTYERTYDASPNVYITSLGTFGRSTSSSLRYKTDVADISDVSLDPRKVLDIPVRQYKYNSENIPVGKNADDVYIGLIAEEVAQAYPAAAEYNEDGQVEMWNIKVIVPAMLKIIQDQQKEIQDLKEQIKTIH